MKKIAVKEISQKYSSNDNLDFFNDPDFETFVIFTQAGDVVVKAREMELSQFKLTKAQGEILHRLMHNDKGLTIAEISQWNAKELSSVLNLVNRMEKNGLVKKSRTGGKTKILITEKGYDKYINTTRKSIDMIFSVLSQNEKEQFKVISQKLRDRARELMGINFKPPFMSL